MPIHAGQRRCVDTGTLCGTNSFGCRLCGGLFGSWTRCSVIQNFHCPVHHFLHKGDQFGVELEIQAHHVTCRAADDLGYLVVIHTAHSGRNAAKFLCGLDRVDYRKLGQLSQLISVFRIVEGGNNLINGLMDSFLVGHHSWRAVICAAGFRAGAFWSFFWIPTQLIPRYLHG